MKIELVKLNLSDDSVYKYKHMSFCCDKLKDNSIIQLTEAMYYKDSDYDDIPRMCLVNHEELTEWGEEMQATTYYPIKYCPFCGESIDIEVVAEEDVTEKYKSWKREYDILVKGARVTDSKAKEQHLRKKIQELDDKIRHLYEIGEYRQGYLDD